MKKSWFTPLEKTKDEVKSLTGFTLLELTTVLIILSILAVMAYTGYRNVILNSKKRIAVGNADLIQKAEKIYKLKENNYLFTSDIDEINEKLNLNLKENYFEYEITNDSSGFLVIVKKKEDESVIIKMNADGDIVYP
jgi:prepilin-type N-terminal cleavage/methylation domain-containing protein